MESGVLDNVALSLLLQKTTGPKKHSKHFVKIQNLKLFRNNYIFRGLFYCFFS